MFEIMPKKQSVARKLEYLSIFQSNILFFDFSIRPKFGYEINCSCKPLHHWFWTNNSDEMLKFSNLLNP